MSELLKPYVDFVFKQIFGSEENKNEVLLNFLNEAVKKTEPKPFSSLTLMNTHIDKDTLTDKQSILDIRAKNVDGKQVNLEIQVVQRLDMPKRSLYYWSKMYEQQLSEGQNYESLKKTIAINIINFNLLSNNRFHNVFHLREDNTGEMLIDDIEIHFMELPKLNQAAQPMDDRLVKWLTFIKGAPKERWEELALDTPGLKKAMTTLEFLSQNEEARAIALAREKAIRDEISGLLSAEQKGEAKGIEKVARNLLREESMDVSKIAKLTGLPESEIKKLKDQLN